MSKQYKNIWQTKSWGEMLIKSKQADNIYNINGIQIEKRKVSMGEYGLFVLGINKEINTNIEKDLINLCKKENCLFIQIENNFYTSPHHSPGKEKEQYTFFKEGYYKKFITPHTAIINLELSEEEILANMKPKGRYNIKVATKKGVEVKIVEKTEKNIKKYYNLMIETTSRDGFSGNNLEYYRTFLNSLDNSKLLLAYSEDNTVIAGGIFIIDSNVSIYYYGASTSDKKYRNLMAPYLLQWTAIQESKKVGSKIYDFLGVAGPNEINSPLAGVTDFKNKLTKDIREVSSSYIFINKTFKYYLIQFLRKIKS